MAFVINKLENSEVSILDTSEYVSLSTVSYDPQYTYLESYTVNILYKVSTDKELTLVDSAIEEHKVENDIQVDNKSILAFEEDGLHLINQYIIPNKAWITKWKLYLGDIYTNIYYSDGTSVYDIDDKVVSLDSIVTDNSNIAVCSLYTFNLINTTEEFLSQCKAVLEEGSKVIVRNVLWIGLDVVKYCLSQGWYFEAERRLLQLIKCVGLNNNSDSNNNINPACGCLKTLWMNNGTKRLY